MIRGAILDADGTLLDSMEMWDTVAERFLQSIGVAARPGLREAVFPMSQAESAVYLRDTYGLAMTQEEIERGILAQIQTFYESSVLAKPGAVAFLRNLRERGVRLFVATATDRRAILPGLERTGFLPLLEGVLTCGDLNTSKSSPRIFHEARSRMGTELRETWVFEDSVHAARTAREAGYPVAGVADPFSDQEKLRRVSTLYLPDYSDFEGFYQMAHEL